MLWTHFFFLLCKRDTGLEQHKSHIKQGHELVSGKVRNMSQAHSLGKCGHTSKPRHTFKTFVMTVPRTVFWWGSCDIWLQLLVNRDCVITASVPQMPTRQPTCMSHILQHSHIYAMDHSGVLLMDENMWKLALLCDLRLQITHTHILLVK